VQVRVSMDGETTVVVADGVLDVSVSNEFSQLVFGLHDILGGGADYDFRTAVVGDEAGRSTLAMIVHKFREFDRRIMLPAEVPRDPDRIAG
jgi:hypothetical protein